MYHLFLHFLQRFSYLQQYLIVTSLSLILLLIFQYWWCLIVLPCSTILVHYAIKRLAHSNQSPLKCSGYLYKRLLRKRPTTRADNSLEFNENAFKEEYAKYIKTITARYICAWYYPFISTDPDFLQELGDLFTTAVESISTRLKSLDTYELIRLIIDLKQKHVEQYLYSLDSYRRQRRQSRLSKSVVEEFCQIIGFHSSLIKNDMHAYFRALVELLLTEFLPEKFPLYSSSIPVREFLIQILVNCIFLPLFIDFSKPRTIYHLLIILLEDEEQKKAYEANENSFITPPEMIDNQNEKESIELLDGQSNSNEKGRKSSSETIIYSATIITIDTAYNPMTGAAYTVYIIQCETKSPFVLDAIDRYTIRRRFREFNSLHRRLQQNRLTSQECSDIDEIYRALPLGMDNMNADIIRRRKCILEQYIHKIITNAVLNCSHDVLEFFAYNTDPNIQFESSSPNLLPVPRVDKALLRTLSDVGNKLTNLLPTPTKREIPPLRETFQLNVATTCEQTSPMMEQLTRFNKDSSALIQSIETLNSADQDLLQTLLGRTSITSSHGKETKQSEIPLTDAVLNLIYTCLHSRDAIISNESIHLILRTILGHLIEEFLKAEIDDILSPEKILTYLFDLRTKVIWPNEFNPSKPIKNVKHRAYNAIRHKIPMWLQHLVGVENINRILANLLECLSHEQLNRHFLLNAFDSLIVKLIPDISSKLFLTKYVHMHTGSRS